MHGVDSSRLHRLRSSARNVVRCAMRMTAMVACIICRRQLFVSGPSPIIATPATCPRQQCHKGIACCCLVWRATGGCASVAVSTRESVIVCHGRPSSGGHWGISLKIPRGCKSLEEITELLRRADVLSDQAGTNCKHSENFFLHPKIDAPGRGEHLAIQYRGAISSSSSSSNSNSSSTRRWRQTPRASLEAAVRRSCPRGFAGCPHPTSH